MHVSRKESACDRRFQGRTAAWLVAVSAALVLGGSVLAHSPQHNPIRGRYVRENGIPEQYRNLSNPLRADEETLAQGERLYTQMCAVCHGETGAGDGPAARTLDPPPPTLVGVMDAPLMSDGYLYWAISEGGVPVGSSMPPFKGSLSERDRWAVITYLREGLGQEDASGDDGDGDHHGPVGDERRGRGHRD